MKMDKYFEQEQPRKRNLWSKAKNNISSHGITPSQPCYIHTCLANILESEITLSNIIVVVAIFIKFPSLEESHRIFICLFLAVPSGNGK